MSAPKFGDRVKLMTAADGGRENESKEPGEVGVVLAIHDNSAIGTRSVVELRFHGDRSSITVPLDDVTTDLSWATPREEAALWAIRRVLRDERCAQQEPKVSRIARKVLDGVTQAQERFDFEASLPKAAEPDPVEDGES